MTKILVPSLALFAGLALSAQQPPAVAAGVAAADRTGRRITSGDSGAAPRFAVPDFIALSSVARSGAPDTETADAARTIARVLWDDLNFEREFALIPRDVYATIPAATSMADVPFDRWRELNADGVDRRHGAEDRHRRPRRGAAVQRPQRVSRRSARSTADRSRTARVYAHTIADEIHQTAARAARRRAHEADLQLRSRRRADERHGREPRRRRRSTSPTTTARTSGGSRPTAR